MAIKKIMCCCGSGVGSSFIMEMNVNDVLKDLGHGDVEVTHSTISDCREGAADLFVVGADLADFVKDLPQEQVVTLKNIIDKVELKEKLEPKF